MISGGSGSPESLLPDATPTPPSSLDLPRDRRPLSARGSNNSDSIEDYIRNWKKNDSGTSSLHFPGIKSVKSNNSSAPSNKDMESVKSSGSTDTTSKSGNKPPVLLPKPNPDLLVKRFKFKKLQKPENDNNSSTSSTSSPAVDRSSSATTTNNVVRKLSTEFEKPKAPTVSSKLFFKLEFTRTRKISPKLARMRQK